MDFKTKETYKQLLKLGFPDNLALICACAKHNQVDYCMDELENLEQENNLIAEEMKDFQPLEENLKMYKDVEPERIKIENMNIEDDKDKK